MTKHCFGNPRIDSIPEWRDFLLNKRKSLSLQHTRADIIHSNLEIKENFDPKKLTFFHWFRAWKCIKERWFFFPTLFLAIVVKNPQDNLATLIIWSCNVTTYTQEPRTRARSSAAIWRQDGGYMTSGGVRIPWTLPLDPTPGYNTMQCYANICRSIGEPSEIPISTYGGVLIVSGAAQLLL